MQINNAAYGAGALLAPLLVAANIKVNNGFHLSYWAIGFASAASG